MSLEVILLVNGQPRNVSALANTPLLYVLRNDLALMGTRFGCGLGQCGACNVLIEGRKVPACDTPLWAASGKTVTTVEGLSSPGKLSVLQQAFVDEQAAQCGYCVSGILISAHALLQENSDPSDAEVRAALDANLCRCGTHNRFVRAVQRAASLLRAGSAA